MGAWSMHGRSTPQCGHLSPGYPIQARLVCQEYQEIGFSPMSAKLSRIAKYTTQQEFELVRDALSTEPRALDKQALRKRIGALRRHMDRARSRAMSEARKGQSGTLSIRKAEIFRDALHRCDRRLLDIEVKEAREQHVAAARKALASKRGARKKNQRPANRTAAKGMTSKPRSKPVPRAGAGREKGHVLGMQRRGQAKRDNR
jgi:hypothetical protein